MCSATRWKAGSGRRPEMTLRPVVFVLAAACACFVPAAAAEPAPPSQERWLLQGLADMQ